MKNTKRKKFVNLVTGNVVEPARIVELPATHMRSGKQTRFWLSRKGIPDERIPSVSVGLTQWGMNHPIIGVFVPFDAGVEKGALPYREEITRLERKLSQAKAKLLEYYAAIPGNLDVPVHSDIP